MSQALVTSVSDSWAARQSLHHLGFRNEGPNAQLQELLLELHDHYIANPSHHILADSDQLVNLVGSKYWGATQRAHLVELAPHWPDKVIRKQVCKLYNTLAQSGAFGTKIKQEHTPAEGLTLLPATANNSQGQSASKASNHESNVEASSVSKHQPENAATVRHGLPTGVDDRSIAAPPRNTSGHSRRVSKHMRSRDSAFNPRVSSHHLEFGNSEELHDTIHLRPASGSQGAAKSQFTKGSNSNPKQAQSVKNTNSTSTIDDIDQLSDNDVPLNRPKRACRQQLPENAYDVKAYYRDVAGDAMNSLPSGNTHRPTAQSTPGAFGSGSSRKKGQQSRNPIVAEDISADTIKISSHTEHLQQSATEPRNRERNGRLVPRAYEPEAINVIKGEDEPSEQASNAAIPATRQRLRSPSLEILSRPPSTTIPQYKQDLTKLHITLSTNSEEGVAIISLRSSLTLEEFFTNAMAAWDWKEEHGQEQVIVAASVQFEWMKGKTPMIVSRKVPDTFRSMLEVIDEAPCWKEGMRGRKRCNVFVRIIMR
ncbi:MAG: hypothetical protein M1812_005678 [Candelaria pacifica]|nr:MAG: hypothetical protein M1812_005678 [Candelaria pacifica]